MKILIDYDITTEGLPQLDVAASSECTLQDPLRQARSELSPSSQLTWRSESSVDEFIPPSDSSGMLIYGSWQPRVPLP